MVGYCEEMTTVVAFETQPIFTELKKPSKATKNGCETEGTHKVCTGPEVRSFTVGCCKPQIILKETYVSCTNKHEYTTIQSEIYTSSKLGAIR
jgi:hypothetical protein